MENAFFIYKITIMCIAKLQYVRVDCMSMLSVPCMHAEASADQEPATESRRLGSLCTPIQQLSINTGIFDPPSLSSAKWNSLSAQFLGLAG